MKFVNVTEPLATSGDLAGQRGAPFTEKVVTAAADAIRTECGWHIAPELTQTVRVRSRGGLTLWLPTLHLVEVTKVVDVATAREVTARWWEVPGSGLESTAPWPSIVDVTMRHGYEAVPAQLLPIIAQRASDSSAGRIRQETIGGRSVALEAGTDPAHSAVLTALTVTWGP